MGWIKPVYPDGASKMVSTPDWWSPNYDGNKVKVEIINLNSKTQETAHGDFRVLVSGQDDIMMNKDNMTVKEAIKTLEEIDNGVTFEYLRGIGFEAF